jgi:two-component system chemotaxis response regulator CheB
MFASLAEVNGRDTVAVVLTGRGKDGAAGAQLVRRMGGHVIVQDPATAEYAEMPRAALRAGAVDAVMPLGDIAAALQSLVSPGTPA